jgi:hypothetical protein
MAHDNPSSAMTTGCRDGRPGVHALLTTIAFAAQATLAAACPEAEIIVPAQGSAVAQARPRIEWKAVAGASEYRVQLESRVPEGRVLAQFDTRVSGSVFTPPSPLTDYQAAVKVRVAVACDEPDEAPVSELQPRFFVDVSGTCPAVEELRIDAATARISWRGAASARRYEVRFFSGDEAAGGAMVGTIAPSIALPQKLGALVVRVQPVCDTGKGPPVFRLFDARR